MFSLFRHYAARLEIQRLVIALNFSKLLNSGNLNLGTVSSASSTVATARTTHSLQTTTGAICFAAAAGVDQRHFSSTGVKQANDQENMENKSEKFNVNKDELKKRLTPLQYQVTQEAATERPFTGCYNKHYEKGVYQCIVCHQDLFSSDTKYDSGCGWPAFNDVLDKGKVTLHRDASIPERIRTEVRCSRCNAHMGHVFEDGPKPTRKRYCINSAAIEFIPADELNSRAAQAAATTSPTCTGTTPIAQQ